MEVIIDGVKYIPAEEECRKEKSTEERFPINSFVEIIGDRDGNGDVGEFGRVVGCEEDLYECDRDNVAVEVAKPGNGKHNCDGKALTDHGWWVHPDDLRLVD